MKLSLASRLNRIEPSPTMEITALANKMRKEGIDVIGFGAGEPDFDTPALIKEAAKKGLDEGKTKYTPVPGLYEFREAIAHKLKKDNNLEYSAEEVIICSGGKQVLYNVFMAILNAGDEVIIPGPYWVSYKDIVMLADGEPTILQTTIDNNYKITPEQLEKSITKKTRAFIINSPSNPTGSIYSADELKALGEVLKRHPSIWIVTDDIYEKIIYDNNKFYNLPMVCPDLKEQTIVVNGLSKAFSMTGWRLGYAASPVPALIKALVKIQGQSTSHATTFAQLGGIEALMGDHAKEISVMLSAFTDRRNYMFDELNKMKGVQTIKPGGAFYMFPGFRDAADTGTFQDLMKQYNESSISKTLSKVLMEKYQVAIVPGVAFGHDNGFRLSYATSMDTIKKGLERMTGFFDSLK